MKRIIASVILLAVTIGLSVTLSSCGAKKQTSSSEYTDYRDIPGVTAAEIAAIEKLKEQYDSFSVKNILSDNMFLKNDLVEFPDSEAASDSTEYAGFSMAFCAYLSQLFGIEFVVGSVDWDSLLSGVSSGEIDFSADLTATEARKQRGYIFSEPIASRHITAFRVKEVNPVPYNQFEGKKRVMFLRGNVNEFNVFNGDLSLYTPVYIDSTAEIV
ncbi:MAG: transporter substrate-binding domain-containing protein, partial [Oscillospiraceae bacterium]|nr:transporter substrate-binding domain-containing protein [Oscillospiraceae bacterium]